MSPLVPSLPSPTLPPLPAQIRKILVRSTNWIGDVVMISPALAALRRRYPDARLHVVCLPHLAECYIENPAVDAVVVFDRRGSDAGAAGLWRFAAKLRRSGYDMAVLFPKAIGGALMARLARIPVRVGLAADGRGWLLTHPVPLSAELRRRHHVEIFLDVARAAGCDIIDRSPFFPVTSQADDWARAFLQENGAGRFPFLMAMHVGASKRPRAWHLERFVETARRLGDTHGAGVLLVGGRGEGDDMAKAAASLGERAINACGRTSIQQMAALIARCRVLLGNDSGPMHLASALGVPVVAIFGPGDPSRTAPYVASESSDSRVAIVSRRYPCAPCRQAFFKECYPSPAGKPMCLESIGVAEVVRAASALIEKSARAAGSPSAG